MRATLLQRDIVPGNRAQSRRARAAAALLVVCWGLVFSPGDTHADDPRRVWKTIETEHFVIHYYEPLLDLARKVAFSAEHSHALLVPVFDHVPREKTQVILVDDTDGANGFASVVPRNTIRLFATAPTATSSLNDHDDWLFGLVLHEYTHILHLDSIGGLPRLVNRVLGKIWAPNQVQPRWLIEGIATYQESRQTSGGRVRNAFFDMNLRVVVLEERTLGLDEITNLPRAWPRGTVAYLYGSHFLDYVFGRYGDEALRTLSWTYGSSAIPYGLNRIIENITGQSFVELYDEWREHLRDKYAQQIEAIERRGVREGRQLTFSAEGNSTPRYARDGRLVIWRQSDGYSETRLRAMPAGVDAGQAQDYARIHRMGNYDVLADGSLIVEQSNTYRTNYDFQDLYRWDRSTGQLERLTRGLRAREPAVSPDERHIAFVMNERSQTRLALMRLEPEAAPRILWQGERFDQVGAPCWSPDGRHVAFSAWTTGGLRDVLMVEVESGAVQRITHDRAIDVDPVFSPDGAYLYYVSDRSGVYNVYAHDRQSGATYQVTNVIGSVFAPAVSPDGKRMAYQGFVAGGYELFELELDPARWLEPLPYVNDRPDPVVVPQDVPVSPPRPYRPVETLAPQTYSVQLGSDSTGQTLRAQTSGADAVGLHYYNLGATLSLGSGDVDVAGLYTYRRLWPSLSIAAGRSVLRRGGLIIDGQNTRFDQDRYRLSASVGLPVLRTDEGSGQLALDYDITWLRARDGGFPGHDPNQSVPDLSNLDSNQSDVSLRFGYSDIETYVYPVGPQRGQSLAASVSLEHPALGSDGRALSLGYRWEAYQRLPWGQAPVLAVRVAGGLRTSNSSRISRYSLGGTPDQDVARAIIDSSRVGVTGYLRGYPSGTVSGTQYHLANLEYRQQLLDFEKGLATLPFYVRRLHVAGLLDVGNAFSGALEPADFKIGLGGALRLDLFFGYFIPGSLEIGYARGLMREGISEYWMLLTGTI